MKKNTRKLGIVLIIATMFAATAAGASENIYFEVANLLQNQISMGSGTCSVTSDNNENIFLAADSGRNEHKQGAGSCTVVSSANDNFWFQDGNISTNFN